MALAAGSIRASCLKPHGVGLKCCLGNTPRGRRDESRPFFYRSLCMSIKVLVADDHEVVRHGLASLLSGSDIKIVAEAKDGKEAIQMARKHRPQVVLLDIRMPQTDGLEALEQLRTEMPETKVIVLSTYDNPTYVARAVA